MDWTLLFFPFCFFQTCLRHVLPESSSLGQIYGTAWKCSAVRSWHSAWAFPAPPSLVPDREREVTSKDSFVVSNEIACLNLMDVWKEPLICVGWQKFHTPDKQQGDIFTFKKKLLGSLDQLPKVKSRCHH